MSTTDGRLVRGARSRAAITRRGVDLASEHGLSALSFGELAADLGLSKSSVQTLFRTKEALQLAVAETAAAVFREHVVLPGRTGAPGLHALIERWIAYAATPLFAGGCFWGATVPDFDGRPGPVRDLLLAQQRQWRALLATELRAAGAGDPELAAFQLDAVLTAANVALRAGDGAAVGYVRRTVDGLLGG